MSTDTGKHENIFLFVPNLIGKLRFSYLNRRSSVTILCYIVQIGKLRSNIFLHSLCHVFFVVGFQDMVELC